MSHGEATKRSGPCVMTGPFIGGWETNAADVGRWTPAQDWYIDADTLGLVDVLVGGRENVPDRT